MTTKRRETTVEGGGARYCFRLDGKLGCWSLGLRDGSPPVLVSRQPLPLVPDIAGTAVDPGSVRLELLEGSSGGPGRMVLSSRLWGAVEGRVINEIMFLSDRLVCRSEYYADRPHALAHWQLAPAGSELEADGVHAYVGSDDIPTNGQIFAAGKLDLSTASHNWLYSPMAPRVLLGRGQFWMALGGTSLAHDFGLELKAGRGGIRHFRFNYGGRKLPMRIAAAGTQIGPRLQVQVTWNRTPDQAHGAFTQAMIDDGLLARRRYRPEDEAWRRPWVCTWGDQMGLARKDSTGNPQPSRVLSSAFVLKVARTIRKNGLPIGTFIIDEGWQDNWGDWDLNTGRIPDMRRLVDQLHAMDFKVLLWWAPFLTSDSNRLMHLTPGTSRVLESPEMLNVSRYGEIVMDYSQPATRAHIQPKLDRFFSSGPGGWDFDGVKIDFMAEKVYPNPRGGDPEWRGEERLMHHLFRMVHETIVRHKGGPGILGEAINPYLAQYCVAFHLEERFDRRLDHIEIRPAMAEALVPGAWLTPHFIYHADLIGQYARRAQMIGAIGQIGKVVSSGMTPAVFADLKKCWGSDGWHGFALR